MHPRTNHTAPPRTPRLLTPPPPLAKAVRALLQDVQGDKGSGFLTLPLTLTLPHSHSNPPSTPSLTLLILTRITPPPHLYPPLPPLTPPAVRALLQDVQGDKGSGFLLDYNDPTNLTPKKKTSPSPGPGASPRARASPGAEAEANAGYVKMNIVEVQGLTS